MRVGVMRRDGTRAMVALTLGNDPTVQLVSKEAIGAPLTTAERTFRDAWLSTKAR